MNDTSVEWDGVGVDLKTVREMPRDHSWQRDLSFFVRPDQLPADLATKINEIPGSGRRIYDVETPYLNGKAWLFEKLAEHQPRAATALRECSGELVVCQDSYEDRPSPSELRHAYSLLIECSGRLIKLACDFHGRNLETGWTAVGHFDWLPRKIAEAYYWRLNGWDVISGIPPASMTNRMLPAIVANWIPFWDTMNEMQLSRAVQDEAVTRLKAFWPQCFPENWKEQHLIRCVIDDRPHLGHGKPYNFSQQGDLIFARAFNPKQELYLFKDGDFTNPQVLIDPVDTFDRYVEHVLLWRKERFDFMPFTRPL